MENYVAPLLDAKAFNCLYCNAYSQQTWFNLDFYKDSTYYGNMIDRNHFFKASQCNHCAKVVLWYFDKIIYPVTSSAPHPNNDLPEDVKKDYDEARSIANLSPRSAGALLRLSIQKLCKHLGKPGQNINDDIKSLVEDGLPVKVQQALDTVRVIGNNCVHPGQIDVNDNPETVQKLFKLINFITFKMITEPKEIDELYNDLPQSQRDAINRRDTN